MATKMKNGLRRFQFYLTEESYQKFEAEFSEFNKALEETNKPNLSESGFCQMRLTGVSPLPRGAPKGNKNARGRKPKTAPDSFADKFSNDSQAANSIPTDQPSETKNFVQNADGNNPTEPMPALGISDDENTRSSTELENTNSTTDIHVSSAAFQNLNSSKDETTKMIDLSNGENLAVRKNSPGRIAETARHDFQFFKEEIEITVENIGPRNRRGR